MGSEMCIRDSLRTVVADSTPSVVAVSRPHRSAIVASTDYVPIFDDNRPNRFLVTGRSLFQDQTNTQKVLMEGRSKLSNDVFMVFLVNNEVLLTI